MNIRKFVCMLAAGFISVTLVGAATTAAAKSRDVLVIGKKIDPELKRKVAYADLNLAFKPAQKVLGRRISDAAWNLCLDLNGRTSIDTCTNHAIHSTDQQVAAAIDRAERKMAGLPVGPAIAISIVINAYET